GLPDVDLAYDTIFSSQADTLTLDAGAGFDTYAWNSGSSIRTETPTNSSYYYKVTVTDVNGCGSDKDSTYIETHDLGISNVTSPVNICEDLASATTPINVEVTNYSDSVYSSASLKLFYEFDGGTPVEINTTLTVSASGSAALNGVSNIDVTEVGEHTLKIYTSSDIDANHSNDTLEYVFETWPLPNVDLAYDTIFTTKPDTVLLIAQPGYDTYAWSDGITNNDTLEVSKFTSENYIVTVTDVHACGEAKDSTQIITYNLGITSLIAPGNKCDHTSTETVKISVKNYGADKILSGTTIPISYELNGGSAVNENYVLTEDLNSLDSRTISFSTKVDLSIVDVYKFKTYIGYKLDVYQKNDTLIDAIRTYGYPSIDLGEDIYTTQPDTLFIVADPGYNNYLWDDGTNNDSLEVNYLASRSYAVTVYDINGCTANDNINVYTYDIAASEIVSPVSQCILSGTETVSFDVINNSLDTLLSGDAINVSYVLNSGAAVNESFNLAVDSLKPGETVNYTFAQTADLSNNQLHVFELYAERASNDAETNDAITRNIDYQAPIFDLGSPVNTGLTQYTIDAGSGYTDYLWFDGSDQQTYIVDINDQNPNNYYAVTVTNSDGCSASDSLEVTFTTVPDLELTNMTTPVSQCWESGETYPVHIVITNSGVVNLNPGESFTVGYKLDNNTPVTETFNLSAAMDANDTREHTFATEVGFDEAKVFELTTFVKLADDATASNDSLKTDVDISAPEVILGSEDTIYFTNQVELEPDETYLTYLWSTGSTTSAITVTETGTYSVTITDEFGCSGEGSIYCEKFTGVDGIDNLIQGKGFEIKFYPNPVSDKLLIEFKHRNPTDIVVEILSSNGQVIFNDKLSKVEERIERIDVDSYANGIYYLRLKIEDNYFIRKIIIQ
ncbi:MAG: hypothetical protein C0597_07525, partial [Marinilabiliales bacterium]